MPVNKVTNLMDNRVCEVLIINIVISKVSTYCIGCPPSTYVRSVGAEVFIELER